MSHTVTAQSVILTFPLKGNVVGGLDVGGTKVDVLFTDVSTGRIVFRARYRSSDFVSLDALLDQIISDLGYRPGRIVMAIAGPRQSNGDVQMTNTDWPIIDVRKTIARTGIRIETVNDMVGTVSGLGVLNLSKQTMLKRGSVDPDGPKLGITVSTGVGDGIILSNGTSIPGEAGHATWQPQSPLEFRYLQWLQNKYDTSTITVELAISGDHGFPSLYQFLIEDGWGSELLTETRNNIANYVRAGEGYGPGITEGAIAGDKFSMKAMEIFGSILGQHTRNRAVSTLPTGGIFFVGSVMQAPGVTQYVIRHTPFLETFLAEGAKHIDLLRRIPIFTVTDKSVAVKGTLELAKATQGNN